MTGSIGCTLFVFLFKSIRLLSLLDNAVSSKNSNNWHKLTVFHLPFYLPFARIYLPFWGKTCFSQNTPGNEKRLNYELFS